MRIALMLSRRDIRLICPGPMLQARIGMDNYFISLVEQELAARATAFIGSKYSTWTDTVKGLRAHAQRPNNFLFEDLWMLGVQ